MAETKTFSFIVDVDLTEDSELQDSDDIGGKLTKALVKSKHFEAASAQRCPTNPDISPRTTCHEALDLINEYVGLIERMADVTGLSYIFKRCMRMLVVSTAECRSVLHCLDTMEERGQKMTEQLLKGLRERKGFGAVDLSGDLSEVPEDNLRHIAHAMIHEFNLNLPCDHHATMSREQLVKWINDTAQEQKKELRKNIN